MSRRKRDLETENAELWQRLKEVYVHIGELLGIDDDDDVVDSD